jgi:dienelactone hydrolase
VRYADGRVIPTKLPNTPDLSSEKAVYSFLKLAESCLEQRLADIARVKAALMKHAAPPLNRHLDLSRMGVFGFSFGGTCALRLCARDPSFVSGANEDGLFLFDDEPRGPFLFFDGEMPAWLLDAPGPNEDAGQNLIRKAEARIQQALHQPGRQRCIMDGTNHASFFDQIFQSRIPRLARAGHRPAAEVHRNLTDNLADFFYRTLR